MCKVTEDEILGRKWDKGKGGFGGERKEQLGVGKLMQNPSGPKELELGSPGSFH